jgi:hypothetical protein
MDGERFDALARAISNDRARRDLLTALLAGIVGSLGVGDLLAKRRTPDRAGIHTARKKKHKKKHKKKGRKKANGGWTPGPQAHHCAANPDESFRATIRRLPANDAECCHGLNKLRREHFFIQEPSLSDEQIVWSAPTQLTGFEGAVTKAGLFITVLESLEQRRASARQTQRLPAGFNPLSPSPVDICQRGAELTDPVPNGVVCVQGTATVKTAFDVRVYRPDWDYEQGDGSAACKGSVKEFFDRVDKHEGRHVQDAQAIAAWYRSEWEGALACFGCAKEIAGDPQTTLITATSAMVTGSVSAEDAVQQGMTADILACNDAFHAQERATDPIECDVCARDDNNLCDTDETCCHGEDSYCERGPLSNACKARCPGSTVCEGATCCNFSQNSPPYIGCCNQVKDGHLFNVCCPRNTDPVTGAPGACCAEDFPICCGTVCCRPDDVCSDGECFSSDALSGRKARVTKSIPSASPSGS